jgi:hypothetical protein
MIVKAALNNFINDAFSGECFTSDQPRSSIFSANGHDCRAAIISSHYQKTKPPRPD